MPRLESCVDRQQRRMRSGWRGLPRSIPEFLSLPNAIDIGFSFRSFVNTFVSHAFGRRRNCMPADTTLDLLPAETAEAPTARTEAPQGATGAARSDRLCARRRRRCLRAGGSMRWVLFALLPFALIGGGYWYVTGGQVMSTDDAYVEAETVGISTDVSGHRPADRRRGEPARRYWPGSVPPRSPSVPDRPRQRQGQPRTDGADHRVDEAGLWAHAERRRCATGAGRARSGDV